MKHYTRCTSGRRMNVFVSLFASAHLSPFDCKLIRLVNNYCEIEHWMSTRGGNRARKVACKKASRDSLVLKVCCWLIVLCILSDKRIFAQESIDTDRPLRSTRSSSKTDLCYTEIVIIFASQAKEYCKGLYAIMIGSFNSKSCVFVSRLCGISAIFGEFHPGAI